MVQTYFTQKVLVRFWSAVIYICRTVPHEHGNGPEKMGQYGCENCYFDQVVFLSINQNLIYKSDYIIGIKTSIAAYVVSQSPWAGLDAVNP